MDAHRRHQADRHPAPRRRLIAENRILGAILAGGQSRRFGSDKGAALVGGKAIIDHVAEALRPQCATLVIAGRDWPGLESVADHPAPGLGPLGGLCGALNYAEREGFTHVLSAPCDTLPIPTDLASHLGDGGVFDGWPLIGLWPVALAPLLSAHLQDAGDRSVYGWLRMSGLPALPSPTGMANINTREDLARLR